MTPADHTVAHPHVAACLGDWEATTGKRRLELVRTPDAKTPRHHVAGFWDAAADKAEKRHRAIKRAPPESVAAYEAGPYGSLEALLTDNLGAGEVEVSTLVATRFEAAPVQADKSDVAKAKVAKGKKGFTASTSSDATCADRPKRAVAYLAGRIKRLAAKGDERAIEVAAKIEAGGYASMRAAAIAAGVLKVPTPVERARRAFARLTEEERGLLLRELNAAWPAQNHSSPLGEGVAPAVAVMSTSTGPGVR